MTSVNNGLFSKESLFLRFPPTSPSIKISIDDFLISISSTTNKSYTQLIDYTYYLLKGETLTLKQILKVWEIRLILLLFNNQISFAKREAINLNNALYTFENGGQVPINNNLSQVSLNKPPLQREASRLSSINSIGSNTSNSGSMGGGNGASSGNGNLQPIYPLPKNNNGLIEYSLLILLLRLKSIPNMNLINELYKLCYQLRLGSKATTSINEPKNKLNIKLINLSYEIVVILTITNNYVTLITFLKSILHDLNYQIEKLSELSKDNQTFRSNILLLWIIINLTYRNKLGKISPFDTIEEKFQEMFNEIDDDSIKSLKYILTTISPTIEKPSNASSESISKLNEGKLPDLKLYDDDFNLRKLTELVVNGNITGRIICSTLGLWDISNIFDAELISEDGKNVEFMIPTQEDDIELLTKRQSEEDEVDEDEDDDKEEEDEEQRTIELSEDEMNDRINIAYSKVTKNWSKYIYKVYGLE